MPRLSRHAGLKYFRVRERLKAYNGDTWLRRGLAKRLSRLNRAARTPFVACLFKIAVINNKQSVAIFAWMLLFSPGSCAILLDVLRGTSRIKKALGRAIVEQLALFYFDLAA
jgi:hypothetical protein